MNKPDLVQAMAEKSGLSKSDAEKALVAFEGVVKEQLSKGESITLVGFGSFEVKDRPERKGRNPKTGEELTILASRTPSFKAGKSLKDAVNSK